MNLVQLAQRIRDARIARQLTLEEVAIRSQLTRSFLSKVENFRATPSLPALGKIAAAIGISLGELVNGLDERPQMVVVRREQRIQVERDRPDSRISYFALAHTRPNKLMEPFLLEVPPGLAPASRLAHEGEEFIMVLDGEVNYEYGDQQMVLRTGDCMYADGNVEHTLNNSQDKPAAVLVVYTGQGANGESALVPAREVNA